MTEMTEMTREEALAHFGVKGMKWGVRNDRDVSNVSSKKTPKTDEQRRARNKKIAIGVGAVAATAVLAVYGTKTIKRRNMAKNRKALAELSEIRKWGFKNMDQVREYERLQKIVYPVSKMSPNRRALQAIYDAVQETGVYTPAQQAEYSRLWRLVYGD